MNEIYNNLKLFLGEPNLNFSKNVYDVKYEYNGHITTLEVSYKTEPYEYYRIVIANSEKTNEPCLDLRIKEQDGKIVGYVYFIRSLQSCNIPEKRGGSWIMMMVTDLLCKLGVTTATLVDDSLMDCNGEDGIVKVKFPILRIYQGKMSWYKEFGYKPNFKTQRLFSKKYSNYTYSNYLQDIQKFVNIDMDVIINTLNNSEKYELASSDMLDVIREDTNKARDVLNIHKPKEKTSTLGKYMSNLWNIDCNSYYKLDKYIRTTSRPDNLDLNYPWATLFNTIDFVTNDFVNDLKCF